MNPWLSAICGATIGGLLVFFVLLGIGLLKASPATEKPVVPTKPVWKTIIQSQVRTKMTNAFMSYNATGLIVIEEDHVGNRRAMFHEAGEKKPTEVNLGYWANKLGVKTYGEK